MVDTVKAKQTAIEMQNKAETILKAVNTIDQLAGAKDMLHSDKSGMTVYAHGSTLRIRDISEIVNERIAKSAEKIIDETITAQEQCITELLGEVEPVKRKAKQPSM